MLFLVRQRILLCLARCCMQLLLALRSSCWWPALCTFSWPNAHFSVPPLLVSSTALRLTCTHEPRLWRAAQQAFVWARMAALCAPTAGLALRTSRRRATPPGMAARRVQAAAKKREAPGLPSVSPLQVLFATPGTKHLRKSLQALSQELLAAEPQPQSLNRCAWPLCALWQLGVGGEQSPSFLNLPPQSFLVPPSPLT